MNILENPKESELDEAEHISWRYQPNSAYFIDLRGRYLRVNQAKANHWNTTPEAMKGKTDFDFMSWTDALNIFYSENSIWETGIPIQDEIEKITNTDGSKRWNSVTKKLVWLDNGKIIGISGTTVDVTEREEARQAQAEAKKTSEAVTRMAAHDLRNPVNIADGWLDRMLRGKQGTYDDNAKATIIDLKDIMTGMKNILADYLGKSKSLLRDEELSEKYYDMRMGIIEPVFDELKTEIDERCIEIDISMHSIPIGTITVPEEDRVDLQIIFRNLLSNSVRKFEPKDKGKISFGVEYREHNGKTYPVLNLWDNGKGVPEDQIENLFVHKQGKTSTGFGLPTCCDIVRRHPNGDLWYEPTRAKHPNFLLRYWRPVN